MVDILAQISGVEFDEAYPNRIRKSIDVELDVNFIGLEALLKNKKSTGRPQDAVDYDKLIQVNAGNRAE